MSATDKPHFIPSHHQKHCLHAWTADSQPPHTSSFVGGEFGRYCLACGVYEDEWEKWKEGE